MSAIDKRYIENVQGDGGRPITMKAFLNGLQSFFSSFSIKELNTHGETTASRASDLVVRSMQYLTYQTQYQNPTIRAFQNRMEIAIQKSGDTIISVEDQRYIKHFMMVYNRDPSKYPLR
jgi:hypothetical protein